MKARGIPHDVAPATSSSALEYVRRQVIPAAMSMLPQRMDSIEARVMLVAIGMQESRFEHRRQLGGGPAISFWQGERTGGFPLLVKHGATAAIARDLLKRMAYGEPDVTDFYALEHNDIAACIAARLLLWTHTKPLPEGNAGEAWRYYIDLWRPGKPHRETWDAFYLDAWLREVA